MQEKPAPEYIHLFNAVTKTIESLQELLIMQVIAKSAIEEAGTLPDQPSKFLLRAYDEQIAALRYWFVPFLNQPREYADFLTMQSSIRRRHGTHVKKQTPTSFGVGVLVISARIRIGYISVEKHPKFWLMR